MEGISASMYTKVRSYWRRRGYRRLNNDCSRRRANTVELGGSTTGTRRKRFWRVKIKPKLKILKMSSPKKFLLCLRDAYVKMMLKFANSRVVGAGNGGGGFDTDFRKGQLKEYDEKMIIEIYKSLVIGQGHLVHRTAPPPGFGTAGVPRLAAIVE